MKTKLNLFFLSLLMTGIITVNAQSPIIGIRAGANIATISGAGNIYDNSNLKSGSSFSAMLGYSLDKTWSLFGELGFEQKGFQNSLSSNSIESKITRRFDYINIPVALRGTYPLNDKISIYGQLGPYNSFLVNSKYDETRNGESIQSKKTDPNINSSDFGWWLGGGVEFPIAGKKFNADLRYSRGIMEVDKTNSELRNKSLTVSLGFWF
jgi:opacity protein-like surface antigen